MPSVGRRKKFLVLGVAAAVLGVTAPRASADNEVWFWACQAPSSSQLAFSLKEPPNWFHRDATGDGAVTSDGDNACVAHPITGTLAPNPSSAAAEFNRPPGTTLTKVRVTRATHGFGAPVAGDNSTYRLSTEGGDLEPSLNRSTATGDLSGELTKDVAASPSSGDAVHIAVSCSSSCGSSPVSFDVSRVGMQVVAAGASKPQFGVGGVRSPVGGNTKATDPEDPNRYLNLDVQATSPGAPLYYAEAFFSDNPGGIKRGYFGGCTDLTPTTPTVLDFALGACSTNGNAAISKLDAGAITTNGVHTLIVRAVDVLGNTNEVKQDLEVLNNVNLGVSSQTLSIGTSGIGNTQGTGNNTGGGSGGVAGASSQNCKTPRMSVVLIDKPLKVSKGVPVLRANHRYRFKGRLTCVINGKRKSAPKRARIDLQNKIGKKTYDKSGTTVHNKGNFTIIVSYRSSRTMIFRFTNSDGKRSQVSIKVKVQKPKKKH